MTKIKSVSASTTQLKQLEHDKDVLAVLERIAKKHYPAQWRIALNCLQYGYYVGKTVKAPPARAGN